MNSYQKQEVEIRGEILEILARAYRHVNLLPRIKRLKKEKTYSKAISTIHEVEHEMRRKKHESFRKKLRQKFRRRKGIKRKKR
jgi:predicted RNA-binding protein associated with RNAse of E/G family